MAIPSVDLTTLNNVSPNLDIGDVADPALRLAAFQYLYNKLQEVISDLNAYQGAGAITSVKLADGSVLTVKLADNAVTGDKILDGAIVSLKLADGAVATAKILDGAITLDKMAVQSVDLSKLTADAIDSSNHTYAGQVPFASTTQSALDALYNQLIQAVKTPGVSETSDARVSAVSGKTYNTLKERVDGDADLLSKRTFMRYGPIILPADFNNHNLNFNLWRGKDGKITHNFDINKNITVTAHLYVDGDAGLDTNAGTSSAAPVKTIVKVFDLAEAMPDTGIKIHLISRLFARNTSPQFLPSTPRVLTKNYIIAADNAFNESIVGSAERSTSLTWTADGAAWKTTRSSTLSVFDLKYRDYLNDPTQYIKAASIAECQATKGSWYTDGTSVWVRRLNDEAIDADVNVLITTSGFAVSLTNTTLYLENITFMYASPSNVKISGSATSKLIGKNCAFLFSNTGNALSVDQIKSSWMFNCRAAYANQDGFNYHGNLDLSNNQFMFEFECISHDNGYNGANNNNATTAHDGMSVLRIGCIGYNCNGPQTADVNGVYSINYDCTMYDSTLSTKTVAKAGFYFDQVLAVKFGKVYLINCKGGGLNTYSVNSDGKPTIYLHNFAGGEIPKGTNLVYLE